MLKLIALCVALSGCAVLPDTVGPELEHMSHATQHAPFTSKPTAYGANVASVVLGWQRGPIQAELAEGLALNRHYPQTPSYGELIGPREEFSARIRYNWSIPK